MSGRTKTVIKKVLDTLTGASLREAAEKNAKTAADLKDAVAKARAKIDATLEEERKAAQAAERK